MQTLRTPDDRFSDLKEYPFAPNYVGWEGLRMHYVDEGPRDAPVMLMVHGMPTWSYLYRNMITKLIAEGYRCIAPDHIGFGRSDKVLDDAWYSIEKHSQALSNLVRTLDLTHVTLICQDWGGPTGLRQAVDMPERFDRLCIMNTWLHEEDFAYTQAIRNWIAAWQAGGRFFEANPCGELMKNYVTNFKGSTLSPEEAFVAYEAPFPDKAAKAGPRRFPLSIPLVNPLGGNAKEQARCANAIRAFGKPVHFIWGCADNVFDEAWGETWSSQVTGATLDKIPDAGHFLQETHAGEIVDFLLTRIAEE